MTEGRKSRWGTRALFCALAALAIAAAAPAAAGASPSEDEYDLNLPEADGQSNGPNQQSAGDSSAPTAPTEPSPSASQDGDDAQGAAAGGGSGGKGDGQGGGATGGGDKSPSEPREQPFASSADEQAVPDLAADRSDGGGVSMPLILLAVAAAACAGIAFWRLRRSKDDSDEQSHEPGARPGDVAARGTQSS
jgi:cobalamin biosynthesis Mg chelatase CobN